MIRRSAKLIKKLNFFHEVINYEPKLPMVDASKLRDGRRKKFSRIFLDMIGIFQY